MDNSKIQAENSQAKISEKIENALKDIYCFSGLGADERVFQKLKFEGYQPIHIKWEKPEAGENISDYTQRLASQIKGEQPIFIGLSFGGMIAIEMSKYINPAKVILISSVKNQQEIPFYFKLWRWLPIYRLFSAKLILKIGKLIASWFFSLESTDERNLLTNILLDTDACFVKWAIQQIVTWKNNLIPKNVFHIHGESDRIFPYRFVHEDFKVNKGGHFMIMNQAEYISNLIQKIINLDNIALRGSQS